MLTHALSDDISLILLEARHAPALFARIEENRSYLRQWLPWVDTTRSEGDTLAFIRRTQQQLADNNGLQTAIQFRGEIIGMIGQPQINWAIRSTALGYWLAEPFQRRGIISACCRAYIAYSLGDLGLNRVEIRAAVENRRSRAVPERLGFQLEGVIRDAEWLYDHFVDHAVYSLLQREWQAQAPAGWARG